MLIHLVYWKACFKTLNVRTMQTMAMLTTEGPMRYTCLNAALRPRVL